MIPTWRELMTVPMGGLGQFSKVDLDRFLFLLQREIAEEDSERGADQLMVIASLLDCKATTTDREAEFVRRGMRLGLHLASFHRDAYYRVVQAEHRDRGTKTKKENLADRNDRMVEMYRQRRADVGCLSARREIRDVVHLSLRQVNNILTEAGEYNGKKKR